MGGYYTFAEIEEHLDELFTDYPELITEKVSLGQTLEGRDIWMVKVSDNPEVDEVEPEILYTGLHHAREPMSYMNLFYYMNWLVENYGTDVDIEVDITPKDYANGTDTQLDRGIKEILNELKKNPVKKPKFDNKPNLNQF